MKKWNRVGAVVAVMLAVGLGGAISARAQDITEFRNGYITFTNENPTLYYRIEFKPNLTDPVDWDGAYRGLRNINSPDAEVTVPVGMFFRVVGRETPWVDGTALAPDLLTGKTAYVDDEKITGTMPNVGQQNVTPGTSAQTITQGYHDGTGEVAGDADLVAGNIKKDVTIFGVTGTHEGEDGGGTYNAGVPKTGQTTSYRDGDDGTHQKGVAWPDPRFMDNEDGTVTDNMTGLMWVKAPHSLSGNSERQTWNNAIDFCNDLAFAGHSDWRLPNRRELFSLIDDSQFNPALPSGHPFTGVQSCYYWSSSTYAVNTSGVWYVNLGLGSMGVDNKALPATHVWPVRCSEDAVSQTQIFAEDFNAAELGGAPAGWNVDATFPEFTWAVVESYGADYSSLDGTPFLFVDSDAAGQGYNLYETITTPSMDATGHDGVFLAFEQYYRQFGSQVGTVQVYDGSEWQTVAQFNETHGSWTDPDEAVIDIADHANDAMRVRFVYEGSYDWYWAIDNVRIYGEPVAD